VGAPAVQLRYNTSLSDREYVRDHGWRAAVLPCCPLHPHGGCSFSRHGTYARVDPPGTRIARWYCPQGHCTFSLLPDFYSAHLRGTLEDLEQVVGQIEQSKSIEAAADALRTDDITLPSAIRWARRRLRLVHAALESVVRAAPERFLNCRPSVSSFQFELDVSSVLPELRKFAAAYLHLLPSPLGFATTRQRHERFQHEMGPDPPNPLA